MAFCSYCGAEMAPGARFCPSCGAAVTAGPVVPAPEVSPAVAAPGGAYTNPGAYANPGAAPNPDAYTNAGPADYSVVLCSLGTCQRSYADDLLMDILGYTNAEANQIISMLPTQIAQLLTMEQAQYIAQALTEYGMQVAVLRGDNEVDLSGYARGSVFNPDGTFVTGVLAALAGVGLINRLTGFRRWSRPSLLQRLFAPRYRWAPPRHVPRRPARPPRSAPAPGPAPRAPMPRKLEQPRRTGDVIRGVTKNRDNRGGIRGGGPGGMGGGRGPGGGGHGGMGGGRGPGGGGHGGMGGGRGPGGGGHGGPGGGHGGPGGRH